MDCVGAVGVSGLVRVELFDDDADVMVVATEADGSNVLRVTGVCDCEVDGCYVVGEGSGCCAGTVGRDGGDDLVIGTSRGTNGVYGVVPAAIFAITNFRASQLSLVWQLWL